MLVTVTVAVKLPVPAVGVDALASGTSSTKGSSKKGSVFRVSVGRVFSKLLLFMQHYVSRSDLVAR